MSDHEPTKFCPRCKQDLPISGFQRQKRKGKRVCKMGLAGWCKKCYGEVSHARNEKRRLDFLNELGGKCVRCGFNDPRALQVDHVFGDGAKCPYRQRAKCLEFIKYVLSNRDRFQVLCANCNAIKRIENGEHGKPGRKPFLAPLTTDEYDPADGYTGEGTQAWHDSMTPEERAAWKAKIGHGNRGKKHPVKRPKAKKHKPSRDNLNLF